MVKIRLRRVGAKKQPSYRIVVTDSASPRDGRFLEIIGHYNPRTEPETSVVKRERALHWLQLGAQPSDAVERLLKRAGVMDALSRVQAGASAEEALAAAEPVPAPAPAAPPARPAAAPPPEAPSTETPPAESAATMAEAEPELTLEEDENMEVPPEALPVADLELPEKVTAALEDAGLHTVGDVMTRLAKGERSMLEIPDIGGRDVEQIKNKVRQLGLLGE